jgi:hypothetical protein
LRDMAASGKARALPRLHGCSIAVLQPSESAPRFSEYRFRAGEGDPHFAFSMTAPVHVEQGDHVGSLGTHSSAVKSQ